MINDRNTFKFGNFAENIAKIMQEHPVCDHQSILENVLAKIKEGPCVIWGSGSGGHDLHSYLQKFGIHQIELFCDTYKRGTDQATGIAIISPEELAEKYKDATVIIGVGNPHFYDEICTKITELNFTGAVMAYHEVMPFLFVSDLLKNTTDMTVLIEKYGRVWDYFVDDASRQVLLDWIRLLLFYEPKPSSSTQYFDPEIINLNDKEVFVDGGFYTGDTTEIFIHKTGGHFKHIFGFEPDISNSALYKPDENTNITIVSKGLWSCDDVLFFKQSSHPSTNEISSDGNIAVPATSIDNFFEKNAYTPTFIKMDIEGAEKQALLGAEKTIKKYKPKLAICVYHKVEDMYELPELIRGMNTDYKLYLRNYHEYTETVLYAI